MGYRIVAKVKFKTGDVITLKGDIVRHKPRPYLEQVVEEVTHNLKYAYKENTPAQFTVGTTVINVLDTSAIDLKVKYVFWS